MSSLCVYAAGRITKERQRFGGSSAYSEYLTPPDGESNLRDRDVEPQRTVFRHQGKDYAYHYSGPFTLSCDHGCAHVLKHTHAAANWDFIAEDHEVYEDRRNAVFARSKAGIKHADWVFAWIDDLECFGTLWELGYAHALDKRIWIALTTEAHGRAKPASPDGVNVALPAGSPTNLWFALQGATRVVQRSEADSAYAEFLTAILTRGPK